MIKFISFVVVSMLLISTTVHAKKKPEVIVIKTSAQCEMCKTRIETAMAFEKGIVKSDLNLTTKELTVTFRAGKTTPEKIRKALNEVGYDADETFANEKAYASLPGCCKKPDDPDHIDH